ncbi:MAG: hypothetical protein AAF089_08380 [Bacteroidota bacterium]
MEPYDAAENTSMPGIGRVVGINLLVLVGLNVVALGYASLDEYSAEGAFVIFNLAIVAVHAATALLGGLVLVFVRRYREVGLGLLLSALAVLVIGSSFCFGGIWVFNTV